MITLKDIDQGLPPGAGHGRGICADILSDLVEMLGGLTELRVAVLSEVVRHA